MAKFIKSPLDDHAYWNLERITLVRYMPDKDMTNIYFGDDDSPLIINGDCTNAILNANNELTMHDKHVANLIIDKFKMHISSIIAKLDKIIRLLEKNK